MDLSGFWDGSVAVLGVLRDIGAFTFTQVVPILRDVALALLGLVLTALVGTVLVFFLWIRPRVEGMMKKLEELIALASEVLVTSADTARNVRGTTSFVTEHAAKPVIEVLSVLSAAAQFARTAFAPRNGPGKKPEQ